MDNGILYFKNVSLQYQESKQKNDKEKEYEHTEANCILDFTESEHDYDTGKRYLHTGIDKFVSISEIKYDDDNKPISYALKIGEEEEPIILKQEELSILATKVDVTIRVFSKTGIKNTIKGQLDTNQSMLTCTKELLDLSGLNSSRFKFLISGKTENNKIQLQNDTKFNSLYDENKEIIVLAVESLGKPSKWKRFSGNNGNSEWSNSGSSWDSVQFIPTKDILLAGFSNWAPKNDPNYYMKYKIEVNERVVAEDQNATQYSNIVDTYYVPVFLKNPVEVKANSKIKMTCWISKDFSNSSTVYTYYGTNGNDYASLDNTDKGLFTVEDSGSSQNGTSTYQGLFPELYYYL